MPKRLNAAAFFTLQGSPRGRPIGYEATFSPGGKNMDHV